MDTGKVLSTALTIVGLAVSVISGHVAQKREDARIAEEVAKQIAKIEK